MSTREEYQLAHTAQEIDAKLNNVVLYTPQVLIEEQKAQARENVGAASQEHLEKVLMAGDSKNIFDGTLTKGYFTGTSGGISTTSMADYLITGLVAIDKAKGDSLSVSYASNSGNTDRAYNAVTGAAFYDAGGVFVSGVFATNSYTTGEVQTSSKKYVEIPDGAAFVRVAFYQNSAYYAFERYQIEYGTTPTEYTLYRAGMEANPEYAEMLLPYLEPEITKIQAGLDGKKWVAIGDSITARTNNYVANVAAELGLVATNLSVSGYTADNMRRSISDSTYSGYSDSRKTAVEEADLITIWGFINDFSVWLDNGVKQLRASSWLNTCMTAAENLLKTVLQLNPFARIVLIGTTNAWDSTRPDIYQPIDKDGRTVGDYVAELRNVARKYGVEFIDMYHCCPFNPYTAHIGVSSLPEANADNYRMLYKQGGVIYRCELVNGAYSWMEYTGADYLADCVHPTVDGYAVIENVLVNKLKNIND